MEQPMQLIVMRHAKSSWASGAQSDHARPLNARGRQDAPRIAERLVDLGWAPDAVLSSDSTRTRETWARMADHLEVSGPVLFSRALYNAGTLEFRAVVGQVAPSARCVMVLGHNPGWQAVVQFLSGEPVELTTANAALLKRAPVPWDGALDAGSWSLVDVLRPKDL